MMGGDDDHVVCSCVVRVGYDICFVLLGLKKWLVMRGV